MTKQEWLNALLAQTVRKLPEFGVKQREERAVRESERLGLIGRLTRPKAPRTPVRQIEPRNPASGGYRGRHGLDAEDVERAAQIIGERGQAELGAHVGEAAH